MLLQSACTQASQSPSGCQMAIRQRMAACEERGMHQMHRMHLLLYSGCLPLPRGQIWIVSISGYRLSCDVSCTCSLALQPRLCAYSRYQHGYCTGQCSAQHNLKVCMPLSSTAPCV